MVLLLAISAAPLPAQTIPTIAISDGTGSPGGRAEVVFSLSAGGGAVASVQADILFDPTILELDPRTVSGDCTKASRLSANISSVTVPDGPPPPAGFEGRRRLRLAILPSLSGAAPFDDGELFRCSLRIAPGVAFGQTSLVIELSRSQVAGVGVGEIFCGLNTDPPISCNKSDGTVSIQAPTSTPLPTSTPTVEPTHTSTPAPTNTARPTSTAAATIAPPTSTAAPSSTAAPTRTSTAGPTRTSTAARRGGGGGGGCAIAAPAGASSNASWLLIPVVLGLLMRRRC